VERRYQGIRDQGEDTFIGQKIVIVRHSLNVRRAT
jgi:hypothetical protein